MTSPVMDRNLPLMDRLPDAWREAIRKRLRAAFDA